MTAQQATGLGQRPALVVIGPVGRLAELVVADLAVDRDHFVIGSLDDVAALAASDQPAADGTGPNTTAAVDVLVMAGTGRRDVDGSGIGLVNLELLHAAIDGLSGRAISSMLVVSSALIYDSSRDHPLPIDESAVPAGGMLGATPPSEPAVASRLAAERMAADAVRRRMGESSSTEAGPIRLVVLRAVICGGTAARPWFSRSLFARRRVVVQNAAPLQMVHLDDVVSAVRHALDAPIEGTFNIAADGWMTEQTLAHLADRKVRVAAPLWLMRAINSVGWMLGRASTPSTMLGHLVTPTMASSAALRSTGWKPMHSNEEAFLTSSYPSWWGSLTARRRQDVSLGLFVSALVGSVVGLVGMIRRASTATFVSNDEPALGGSPDRSR